MASVADAPLQTALEAEPTPSSIYVLAFHPAWERRVARVLEARGIATATPSGGAWPRATTATLTAAPPHAC